MSVQFEAIYKAYRDGTPLEIDVTDLGFIMAKVGSLEAALVAAEGRIEAVEKFMAVLDAAIDANGEPDDPFRRGYLTAQVDVRAALSVPVVQEEEQGKP